jgi:adenylylsulfate kinase
VVITAFISPYRMDRRRAQRLRSKAMRLSVFVDAPLEVCGPGSQEPLQKARAEEFASSGIDAPYDPDDAEIVVARNNKPSMNRSRQFSRSYCLASGITGRTIDGDGSLCLSQFATQN